MRQIGRPKVSKLSRKDQLRHAKRAQREREKRAGLVNVQLTLPKEIAQKLSVARRAPDFLWLLDSALDRMVIRIRDYDQLCDLAWNRSDDFIPAKEAFQLYERNWRLIEPAALAPKERALIERLKDEFGSGVINA